MRFLRNRTLVGSIGVVGVLASSIAVSGWQAASAAQPPPAPAATTVNQGTGGTSAWKVTGTVSVSNFPSFPATQPVSGTVAISNQTLQVAGATAVLAVEDSHELDVNQSFSSGPQDTSQYKEVKILVVCGPTNAGDCDKVQAVVGTEADVTSFVIDQFPLKDYDTVSVIEDIPGTQMGVQFYNTSPDPVSISYALIGRTN